MGDDDVTSVSGEYNVYSRFEGFSMETSSSQKLMFYSRIRKKTQENIPNLTKLKTKNEIKTGKSGLLLSNYHLNLSHKWSSWRKLIITRCDKGGNTQSSRERSKILLKEHTKSCSWAGITRSYLVYVYVHFKSIN